MVLFRHEMRINKWQYIIWSLAVGMMLGISVLIYPEMKSQMNELSDMFSQMGSFSEAFGMDTLNFGEFLGFFGTECGNTLGLGGGIFAALIGVSVLYKEEKNGTAEFLLAHPITRVEAAIQKLLSVFAQLLIFVLASAGITAAATAIIGESPDIKAMVLIFLAQLLMQLEIASVCFLISSLVRKGGIGLGIGISALFYFLNILGNLLESLEFVKYITPYGFADCAYIVSEVALDMPKLAIGIAISIACILLALWRYSKKEIK